MEGGELIIIDYTNWDSGAPQNALLRPSLTTGGGATAYTQGMSDAEIDAAVAAGTPFAVLRYFAGSRFERITDFESSTESFIDGPTQAQIDQYNSDLAEFNAAVAERDNALADLLAFNNRDVITIDDQLPVDDMHVPALQEFAMYYAYSVDDDMTANSGRAQRHWLAFFQMLNKAEDSSLMISQAREITE